MRKIKGQLIIGENEVLDDLEYRIYTAIERLRMFEPKDGYYLAFSGGKDSIAIYALAEMAGVKFDAHYAITTVDPPELTKFIKKEYPDVERIIPELNMWQLIEKKLMPPTRIVRYCCASLKEEGGNGRTVITGVRWAESSRRKNTRKDVEFDVYGSQSKARKKERELFYLNNDNSDKRRMMESCNIKGKHIVNPVIDWTDEHIWQFIKKYELPYCNLYDKGFKRLGCLGCPMQGKHIVNDFYMYPYVYIRYLEAFKKMIIARQKKEMPCEWKTSHEVMKWWVDMSDFEYIEFQNKMKLCMVEKDQKRYIKHLNIE